MRTVDLPSASLGLKFVCCLTLDMRAEHYAQLDLATRGAKWQLRIPKAGRSPRKLAARELTK